MNAIIKLGILHCTVIPAKTIIVLQQDVPQAALEMLLLAAAAANCACETTTECHVNYCAMQISQKCKGL